MSHPTIDQELSVSPIGPGAMWQADGVASSLLPAALLALGLRNLVTASYIPGWQPTGVGAAAPAIAVMNALFLILFSIGAITGPRRMIGFLGLAGLMGLWILVWQLPRLAAAPGVVVLWLGVAEVGALISASVLRATTIGVRLRRGGGVQKLAYVSFGLCCLVFGVSHFVYADFTSKMIPAWLPARLALAYFTGGAHIAAGLAIASNVLRRLAAVLLACMMAGFVALVHVPAVLATHGSVAEVTFLFNACALCGSAIIVAQTAGFRLFRSAPIAAPTTVDV